MGKRQIETVEDLCQTWCKSPRMICDPQRSQCSHCPTPGGRCECGKTGLRWRNDTVASDHVEEQRTARTLSSQSTLTYLRQLAIRLLYYFQSDVVDQFSLSSSQIQIDTKLLVKDQALLRSILAVASAHLLIHRHEDSEHISQTMRFSRLGAIGWFRKQLALQTESSTVDTVSVTNLFVTNSLLCILDGVLEPIVEIPATHLHGGAAILDQWQLLEQIFRNKQDLPLLMLSIFATMDLTDSLLKGKQPYFPASRWDNFVECTGWWGILSAGDPFLEIMAVLSQLAQLGYMTHVMGVAPLDSEISLITDQLSEKHSYYNELKPSHFADPLSLVPLPLSALHSELSNNIRLWDVVCAVYRHTASIYIYRALYNLNVMHPRVQQATMAGLKAICEIRPTGNLTNSLLFPILIVGSHCRDKEQQQAVLWALQPAAVGVRYSAIQIMERFLHSIWQRSDLNISWWQWFNEISRQILIF
ncbi:transcriptional regulator family: Fungal Specific TF [Paecilomyces variotii]|nr:transcriptional regulator family: Fungal Specific TF [Paecilomyces variotii]